MPEMKKFNAKEYARQQFYRFPKWLAHDERYKDLSVSAKYLYMFLCDRHELSMKNEWIDSKGDIYFIFRRAEMQELLQCGVHHPSECMNELKKFKLVREVRVGLNQPNRLYLLEPEEISIEPSNPHNQRMYGIRTSRSTESVLLV